MRTPDGDYLLSSAYDLLCTRVHSPNERDMAPSSGLFSDYCTPGFDANGFYAYDDFYDFGIHIGIIPKRVERFLEFFKTHQKKVEELIDRSYLCKAVKDEYLNYYKDKLTRLNYSFKARISKALSYLKTLSKRTANFLAVLRSPFN